MTRAELIRRLRTYERSQHFALAIGVLPLLAVYLAVHTRWLKPLMQDHKHLMVALLIVVPLAWMLMAVRGWKRFGPRWLGLTCVGCNAPLVDLPTSGADDRASCPRCGSALFDANARTP